MISRVEMNIKKKKLELYWGGLLGDTLKEQSCADEITLLDTESDPPDALYEFSYNDGKKNRTWIEVTGVYPSDEEAKKAFEFAIKGTQYEDTKLYSDSKIASRAGERILKKAKKKTYANLYSEYGPGHLLLFLPYQAIPLVNSDTVAEIIPHIPLEELNQQCHFCCVWAMHRQPDFDDGITVAHNGFMEESGIAVYLLWPENDEARLFENPLRI